MSRLIEDYIREAFNERQVSEEQREKLWRYYYDKLSNAVDVGYSPTLEHYSEELALSLKRNIAEFSAFKETSFRKQLEASLTDNGRVLSWREFKQKADDLNIEYNRRWLKTEYDQTVAIATQAGKYQKYLANKHLYPNLQYRTIGDRRVREKHQAWDGLILPVEHEFWKTHLPPNDWGCRCYVVPTDEPVSEYAKADPPIKEAFANNPALSGKIFSTSAYLTSGGFNPEMIEKITAWSIEMFNKVIRESKVLLEKSKLLAPYKTIYKAKNGATVKVSPFADKKDLSSNIATAKILAKELGVPVKIRPHLNPDIMFKVKNPEYEILGKIAERKAVETSKVKNLRNVYRSANEQGCECIVFDLDASPLSIEEVEIEAVRKFKTFPKITNVYIIKNGKVINVKSNS
ncbi:phage minor head protein [Riemerella anatipestifer]|uniref:Phage minor head protein n=1 Tax=Riemerella anatipestifer TaxID=34085 RepID=A0AAP6HG35_RIEAN|nr:phage minor head protein [Riemerella anatipestifer]